MTVQKLGKRQKSEKGRYNLEVIHNQAVEVTGINSEMDKKAGKLRPTHRPAPSRWKKEHSASCCAG